MKELLPYLIMCFACLVGLVVEGILLTKVFKKEKAEIAKNYVDLLTQIRKDLENEIEKYKMAPVEIKQTIVPTQEYAKTIVADTRCMNSFMDKDDFMKMIRKEFAKKFAEEVIEQNLNIHEIIDFESYDKIKYMARMWMGF